MQFEWHAHLARDLTDGTPVPLLQTVKEEGKMYTIRGVMLRASIIGLTLMSLAVQPTKSQMEPLASVEPQQALSLAPFTAVELDGGVKAVLQHGSPQRVTMLKGSGDVSLITVTQE